MRFVHRIILMLTGAYWVLIFTLTHLPPSHLPNVPTSDKLKHFVAYLILSFLLGATLWIIFPSRRRLMPILVVAAAAAYGAFDEFTQIAVGRACEFEDWLADVGGAATAGAALYIVQVYLLHRQRRRAEARKNQPEFASPPVQPRLEQPEFSGPRRC